MTNLYDDNKKLKIQTKKISNELLNEVCKTHNIKSPCLVNINICNSDYIKDVNKQMRGINKVTDVLSFPNIDFRNFKMNISVFDLETNNVFLGDVLINADKVITQAKRYEHSVKREFAFLVTHSLLHLLGYDHMTKSQERQMIEMQERILAKLGITR